MKEAVSISLGSSKRDHKGIIDFGDEKISIRREGVDGDVDAIITRYKELDGNVDALGAGGFITEFHVDNRVYPLRAAMNIVKHIKITPLVDGSGVKETIERSCMQKVAGEIDKLFVNMDKTALITAGVDRYEMALSIEDAGFKCLYGDLAFGLGINIKVKSISSVRKIARLLLPIASKFPLSWLYPVGEKQDTFTPKYGRFFKNANLIAGDFLYTKKYAPMDMENKVILTNTTTAEDIKEFKNRGVKAIITTTPDVQGRSFGTNGLEAAITAYADLKRPLTREEMTMQVEKLGLVPQVIKL